MAESSGDISNPQGSQGQGPSELMRGPDWSETRRATARSQKMAERVSANLEFRQVQGRPFCVMISIRNPKR